MDAALRANLTEGLADGLDAEILSGTNGLFTGTNLPDNAQTTNDDFDSYLSHLVWDQIDGRYAAMAERPGDGGRRCNAQGFGEHVQEHHRGPERP